MSSRKCLDLRGLKCPLPALQTRRALRTLSPDELLEVICTDPLAGIDIPAMVNAEGGRLVARTDDADTLRFVIAK